MEPPEPERAAEAREARRSGVLNKKVILQELWLHVHHQWYGSRLVWLIPENMENGHISVVSFL